MADEKQKKQAVAMRDWIDADGKPVDTGDETKAVGFRYIHLPTASRLDPNFNPETSVPHADAVYEFDVTDPKNAEAVRMLAIFGGLTLAGNVVNTAVNGPKGDPNVNPIPLIVERFGELESGKWADRSTGVGGVRYNPEHLALAIAQAKGESDPAPYEAKMGNKVDPKTGQTVAADAKGAISYGAYALRNGAVKAKYDALAGGGTQLTAL